MKEILVGYTGFVGSNLAKEHHFTDLFRSTNIEKAYGSNPDLLVYAGIPGEMFTANNYPKEDLEIMKQAFGNIRAIGPKKIVLISTISIYGDPFGVTEADMPDIQSNKLSAYGKNRFLLERLIEDSCKDFLIVRLPALFGDNLKKNFIYDYIHLIPSKLKIEIYEKLKDNDVIRRNYEQEDSFFYRFNPQNECEKQKTYEFFKNSEFSALSFTDSRSKYQFYDLSELWKHIEIGLKEGLTHLNLATEPIEISELYKYLSGKDFVNILNKDPFNQDMKTLYTKYLGGENGYIHKKEEMLHRIKEFVITERKKYEIIDL